MPSSKKHAPKAVLDTNVWVSALLWGGKPAAVIKAAEEGKASTHPRKLLPKSVRF